MSAYPNAVAAVMGVAPRDASSQFTFVGIGSGGAGSATHTSSDRSTPTTKTGDAVSSVSQLKSTMQQVQVGMGERGEKLASLGEKTKRLDDAAGDFEAMAKALAAKYS